MRAHWSSVVLLFKLIFHERLSYSLSAISKPAQLIGFMSARDGLAGERTIHVPGS